ncbi:hypothetical protein [Desulforamulus aquiferis]|uniref:Uncharacterized protein n=1 Tax=Desulforamulus aquiferis TaxID=1397668 RepID=A0AAW7ZDN2_9FIRM|nr:hypothetical protein [Desulforamulus aquiferis]MDO7787161.1 hypothetical protein [Desulforamulus aquiferis]RYD04854.1 hypothetical protein N752_13080 [Desulforamulus aquiferis]
MKNNRKREKLVLKQDTNSLRFEVAQGIGFVDEGDKVGLTQPTTGADALTKTDHGNFARFNPKV